MCYNLYLEPYVKVLHVFVKSVLEGLFRWISFMCDDILLIYSENENYELKKTHIIAEFLFK